MRAISHPTIAAKGRSYKKSRGLWERALRAIGYGRTYNYGAAFFM